MADFLPYPGSQPAAAQGQGQGATPQISGPQFAGPQHGAPPPIVATTAGDVFDLKSLFALLMRRKYLVAAVVLGFVSFVALIVEQIEPQYRGETEIIVDNTGGGAIAGLGGLLETFGADRGSIQTEASIIKSRELSEQVVAGLGLVDDPSFNPALKEDKGHPIKAAIDIARTLLFGPPAETPIEANPQALSRQEIVNRAVEEYLEQLSVITRTDSNVLVVRFDSPDPERAALVANTTVATYIADRREAAEAAQAKASLFLDRTLNELRGQVEQAEGEIERFRQENDVLSIGGVSVLKEQIVQLTSQAIRAAADRNQAEGRLLQAERLLRVNSGETANNLFQSGLINELKFQESNILRRIADLTTRFREQHPTVQAAGQELEEVRRSIRDEVRKIVIALENEVQIAIGREAEIRDEISAVERDIRAQGAAELKLRTLEAGAQSAQSLFEKALERLNLIGIQDDVTASEDIRVISLAVVPEDPFAPRKEIILSAALLVGGAAGVLLAVLLEIMRTGFRSVGQVEQVLNLPVLSVVPEIDRDPLEVLANYDPLFDPLGSAYSESVRKLRTTLSLIDAQGPPRSIMLTSALSGEGKSTISLSLAFVAARIGQRVLIIDCDLRNPTIHKRVGRYEGPGLIDYLIDAAPIEEVIELDLEGGYYFISAGTRSTMAADLILSQKLPELIEEAMEEFDLVILDSPPVAPVSDSLFLSRLVDRVIYVVRSEKTPRDIASDGLQDLREAGGRIAGVVVSQAEWKDLAYGPYYEDTTAVTMARNHAA